MMRDDPAGQAVSCGAGMRRGARGREERKLAAAGRGWALLAAAIVLLAAACQPLPQAAPAAGQDAAPRSGGVLHYGLTLPVSGIDPHVNASSELGIALSSVYDTLVVQDQGGAFHPALAARWEISDDGRAYTFELRQDVTFHDGTPFNAEAVVQNLARVADPATKSQKAAFLLGPFDRAEAASEFTVRVLLKAPYAPLLDGLSQVYLGMASPAALARWGDQYQLHQVGTGPFKFVSYQERQSLILVRNPDYRWAPEIRAHQGPAYLEQIEFRFYADPAGRLPALLSGQADVIGELPPRDLAQIDGQPGYRSYPVMIPGQSVQFLLNTTLAPLDDVRVRQALLFASDRQALVAAVFGPASPAAAGPLSAVTRWALGAEAAAGYPHDPERAKALLAEAGWADTDGDGFADRAGQKLTLRGVLMSWGELPAVGTILQAQWQAAGIDLALEQMPYPAALEAGRNGTHHLVPFVNSGADASLLRNFFHSENIGGFNWSRVSDPQVDAWLDEAGRLQDPAARGERYLKVQRQAMAQAWTLPIRDQVNLNAAAARVRGLTFDVQGWFPVLYDVWLGE